MDAREPIGGVAMKRRGIHVKALAEALGTSPEGVSKWVQRAARRRSEDPTLAGRMKDLGRRLAEEVESPSP